MARKTKGKYDPRNYPPYWDEPCTPAPPQRARVFEEPTLLYWAYGSNLNIEAMQRRCPGAKKFQPLTIDDGALMFRGVADVVFREGSQVHGGLWYINREHERALDGYEGVSGGLYLKRYYKLLVGGKEAKCLYYQMSMSRGIMPPNEGYLETIAQGYRDFGLPLEALDTALRESWDQKEPTERLVRRHRLRGGDLARSLDTNPECGG